jgi:hypothetical protein
MSRAEDIIASNEQAASLSKKKLLSMFVKKRSDVSINAV